MRAKEIAISIEVAIAISIVGNPPCELNIFVLQQPQNLGQRCGTSKIHFSPLVALGAVRYKAVVLLLLIRC